MPCNKKFQWSQICGEDWKLYLSLRNSPYISILRTLPNPGERNSVSNMFFRDSQGYLMTESLYQPTTVENNLGDLDLQVKDLQQGSGSTASPQASSSAPTAWLWALCLSSTQYPLTYQQLAFTVKAPSSCVFYPEFSTYTLCPPSSVKIPSPGLCVLPDKFLSKTSCVSWFCHLLAMWP